MTHRQGHLLPSNLQHLDRNMLNPNQATFCVTQLISQEGKIVLGSTLMITDILTRSAGDGDSEQEVHRHKRETER